MMNRKKQLVIALSAAGVGITSVPVVQAQQGVLEEITVTARKREESMQDVGLSVSALSETEIQRQFARDIQDLANIAPNLIIDDTGQGPGGTAAIFIRGVGVADLEKNFDPAVGVSVDGVFIGSTAGALMRSIDLARVEVLRGPQGTLFGRNTVGGMINIERTRPTGELGGRFRAGVENYDTAYLDGIFNFALTEDLAVKLTASMRDQNEGYYDNVTRRGDQGRQEYTNLGANFLWNATDTLELEYTYNREELDQDTPPLVNVTRPDQAFCGVYGYCGTAIGNTITGDRLGAAGGGGAPTPPPGFDTNVSLRSQVGNEWMEAFFDTETHIFEVRWDITDSLRMDYIYGRWESDEDSLQDWDGTPDLLYHTQRPGEWEQDSHELRFTWDNNGPLTAQAGLFYWDSEYESRMRSYIGFLDLANGAPNDPAFTSLIADIPQTTNQTTESIAAFLEADWRLSDKWTLTFGGRYTEDEKTSAQFGEVNTLSQGRTQHPSEKWDEFTPRVGLKYFYNEDVMFFANYSVGYRAGGFNGRVASLEEAIQPYDPETVDNYELGVKSELFDNRLRINATIFTMDYQDKQEELQLPSNETDTGQKTVVINPSSATISGFEVDVQAYVTQGLSLRANLGYLDSEYDDFVYTDVEGAVVDLSNLEFRRAPEWTGTLDATYEWEIGSGNAWVRGSYRYIDDHYTSITNNVESENGSQGLVDASVNYAIGDLQFSLFGRNLTDEDTFTHGYEVAGLWSYASVRRPRTYGLEVVYNFNNN
ncbi:TonB-dependent receptor [Pseudohaliea rubra]|uniref:TonB-dependent receptor n=1 Tax=Pseudohaliea rubra DSM 19751 TaxID=1265313 RepID=A0A095VPR3_9GAMM|nr:TonB-dependent receptor [Pseudohaliea rubra]KGE03467.1 TonB-dependent receptor [Pseudohaliea rubra DSM 19751]